METRRREEERRIEEERRRREADRRSRRRESPQRRTSHRSPHRPSSHRTPSSRQSPTRRQRSPERNSSSSTSTRRRESSSSRRTSALERLGPKVPVTSRLGGGGRVSRKRRPGSKERYVGVAIVFVYYRSDLENYGRVSKTEMMPLNIILFLLLESRRGADNFISTYSTFNTNRYSYKEFEDSEERNPPE